MKRGKFFLLSLTNHQHRFRNSLLACFVFSFGDLIVLCVY